MIGPLRRLVGQRAPARPLGVLRIGLGLAALAALAENVPRLALLSDPARLRLPLVPAWSGAVPPGAIDVLIAAWLAASVAFLVGWRSRIAGTSLALVLTCVLALDLQLYSNHLYLLLLLVALATVGQAGAALSLDARRRVGRTVPRWPVVLIKIQASLVYGFAALSKLNAAFLSGGILGGIVGGGLLPVPESFVRFETMYPLAIAAVATEAFVAVGLWFRLTRGLAVALGILFHGATVLFLAPTWEFLVFAATLLPTYAIFSQDRPLKPAPAERLEGLIHRWRKNAAGDASPAGRKGDWLARRGPWLVTAIAALGVLVLHGDYGVTWDERLLATYGERVLDYFRSGGRDLGAVDYFDLRHYGAAVEAGAAALYEGLGTPLFRTRHLLVGLLSVLAIPGLAWFGRRFREPALPLLAGIALLTLPRFQGHAFNNSKDAPFAVAVVWLLAAAAALFVERDYRWTRVGACALALGAALWVRPGALPMLLALLVVVAAAGHALGPPPWGTGRDALLRAGAALAVILPVAWLLMVLPWPWAHLDPIGHPLETMTTAAGLPRAHDVLFQGEVYRSDALPWRYVPHFLLITTPPTILALALLGGAGTAAAAVAGERGPFRATAAITLAWLLLPVAAWMVLRPNVYDGIRHFLFVLPAIAVLAALGGSWIVRAAPSGAARAAAWAAVILCLLAPLVASVRLHPYQIAYYNVLVGGTSGAAGRYETDYWGSSYGEAMRWVNRRPADDTVRVHVAGPEDVEPAAGHAAAPHVVVYSDDDLDRDGPAVAELDYYIATTRFRLDGRYPDAPVVHRVGRVGATFTVVKSLGAAPGPSRPPE